MVDRPLTSLMVVLLLHFGARKLSFWSSNVVVARGHMNDFPDTFFGAWGCVTAPMAVFPLRKIDWKMIYWLVVVFVRDDAWNIEF